MEEVALEVYSTRTNCAVVHPPGRRFPGVVIQGDTLSNMCAEANAVAGALQDSNVDEEARWMMQELLNRLVAFLLHYQDVLQQHGIELPYRGPVSRADFAIVEDDEPPSST